MYLSKVTKLIGGQFQVRICVWLNLKPEACRKYILLVVQLLSHVRIFVTPWTAARQVLLSFTISWSLLKLMSIESVMPSNHLILCHLLVLLPLIFPSSRVFSNDSILNIKWAKYWSFSFSINPFNEYSGLISFRIDWFDLLAIQGTLKSFLQPHSSKTSTSALSFLYGPTLTLVLDYWKNIALTIQIFISKVTVENS